MLEIFKTIKIFGKKGFIFNKIISVKYLKPFRILGLEIIKTI